MHSCSHYLEDLAKHDPEFNINLYKNMTKDEIVAKCRDYYKNNLPVDLLSWCRVNEPGDEMLWKDKYCEQILFIRDDINAIFYGNDYEEYKNNPVMVIGTHRSKSIVLPVYRIYLKDHGVIMILRNNFYDWKISVISKVDLNVDFIGLFDEKEKVNPLFCEGFTPDRVFGSYSKSKKQFTLELSNSSYKLYTFMFLLNNYLLNRGKGE